MFKILGFWFDSIKNQFYAYGMGRCDATLSDHSFIGLKGEFFSFSILVRFHEVKFGVRIYFQSVYITVIVQVIEEKLKIL